MVAQPSSDTIQMYSAVKSHRYRVQDVVKTITMLISVSTRTRPVIRVE